MLDTTNKSSQHIKSFPSHKDNSAVCFLGPQFTLWDQRHGALVHHAVSVYTQVITGTHYAQKQLLLSARLSHRNSVCLSVCHTGGSVKNGAS